MHRSASQCCTGSNISNCLLVQHWSRVLNPDINKGPWSAEEEETLIVVLNSPRADRISWSKVCANLPGRTGTFSHYIYKSSYEGCGLRVPQILHNLTCKCRVNLSSISYLLDTQCRYQYQRLKKSREVPWTKREDSVLLNVSGCAPRMNWAEIANEHYKRVLRDDTKRYKTPPRGASECKNRWHLLTKCRNNNYCNPHGL